MYKLGISLQRQQGISLLESLIAIVVMALGILGILGVQMRTLNDTQTSVRRAQAVRLIEDLSERMKANPNALFNINGYLTGWSDEPTYTKNCKTAACNNAEWASYDRAEWKKSVREMLPSGVANVFIPGTESDSSMAGNQRMVGVLVAWRENEKVNTGSNNNSADEAYLNEINANTGTVSCMTGMTCHLQYLPVSARCAPYYAASETVPQFFCPGTGS